MPRADDRPGQRTNILITGASSGIGWQLAKDFAALGRNLALAARRIETLDALKAELLAAHPDIAVHTYALDVTDHEAVFRVVEQARQDLGRLDRVIVNAGDGSGRPIGTGAFKVNLRVAQVNFVGALAQCEAAVQVFREQKGGHLVLISSVASFRGATRNGTTYAATKAALRHIGEGLRAEFSGTPITVSTIMPGYIRTPMTEGIASGPLVVPLEKGTAAIVAAIEKERGLAVVPAWPYAPLSRVLALLPPAVAKRVM